uniref:Uncharacterized protein n=1 Tax=Phytophthora ramorum TaxID=164328 RepID=H3H537_PHYRM
MVTEIYYRKALAQIEKKHSLLEKTHSLLEDEHSQIKTKHALLEAEHEEMKTKYSKLEEEHAELRDERNDLEGDTWLWMMQNNKLQAQHKELQAEHSQWKAACASLVKEVERKVLEEEYLAYLAQEYGQTQWPVAKVAELEVEQERKLAEAHKLAKEREQALMDKVAALESEIELRRTLRAALEKGAKTALATTNPAKERRFTKPVEVSAPTQQRKTLVAQQEQRPRLREKSSSCGSPSTVSSRASTKATATAATLKKAAVKPVEVRAQTLQDRLRKCELEKKQKIKSLQEQRPRLREKSNSCGSPSTVITRSAAKTTATLLKVPAQTLQRPGRKQELTKPKEIKSVPSKATSRWEHYKNQRSGPSSAATSSTSSSPEMSPRSAA